MTVSSAPVQIALYEPEIPGNAGAVARLCAATGAPLHLIGRLGFSFRHPDAKRAAMDYWNAVDTRRHINYTDFSAAVGSCTIWSLSTRAERTIWEATFEPGDVFLFGPESRGLPADLLEASGHRAIRIPMLPGVRSLNLSTSVAIILYEALRQSGWRGSPGPGSA